MSAHPLLDQAVSAGLTLLVENGDLIVEFDGAPPDDILAMLKAHKAELLAALTGTNTPHCSVCNWSKTDWAGEYDERAGIIEHDGGEATETAEIAALRAVAALFVQTHLPAPRTKDGCDHCGGPEGEGGALIVPFSIATPNTARAWLHHRCWLAWYGPREAQAIEALKAMEVDQ